MNGMKKNVISMLLAVLFVCSLMTPAMAENAEAENSAQAVEQFSYEKRVLAALDIITDGDSAFEVEENVTRAQLTVAIARLYNLAGEAKGKSPFSDVKSSHWASGYITELYNMGMIVGTPDGTFQPDDPVTLPQAAKMAVEAAGYGPWAIRKGGFPSGYLFEATSQGLLAGLDTNAEALTRDMLIKLIYNLANCPLVVYTTFGEENDYAIQKGVTLLTEYKHIYKDTALLVGNKTTYLNQKESGLADDEVKIEGLGDILKVGSTRAADYLGYYVDYYYLELDDENLLLFIEPSEKKNDVITITKQDFIRCENGVVYYRDEDGDEETARLSKKANVIVNGQCKIPYSYSDITIESSGQIVLIDNLGENGYDQVLVQNMKTYVLDEVGAESKVLLSKYNMGTLDLSGYKDEDISILRGGESITFDDLYPWDVLSVEQNEDRVTINVGVKIIRGTVSEISDLSCTIDGEAYDLSDFVRDLPEEDQIKAGSQGRFYCDIFGEIWAYEATASDAFRYGYLMAADTGSGSIRKEIKLKVFTQYGEAKELTCSDSMKVNGEQVRLSTDAGFNKAVSAINSGGSVNKVIKYKEDAEGNIKALYTPDGNLNDSDGLKLTHPKGARTYAGSSRFTVMSDKSFPEVDGYSRDFLVQGDTAYFVVPEDPSERSNEKNYAIMNPSKLVDDDSSPQTEAYDANEVNAVKAVVEYSASGGNITHVAVVKNALAVVKSFVRSVNSEGEEGQKVNLLYNGKEASYFLSNDLDISQLPTMVSGVMSGPLAVGDMIRFQTNSLGEISGIIKYFELAQASASDQINEQDMTLPAKAPALLTTTNPSRTDPGISRFFYGVVYKKQGGTAVVAKGMGYNSELGKMSPVDSEVVPGIGSAPVYVYDAQARNEKVKMGSSIDLTEAMYEMAGKNAKVVVCSSYGSTTAIYIIKF